MPLLFEVSPKYGKSFVPTADEQAALAAFAQGTLVDRYVDAYLQRAQQFNQELAGAFAMVLPSEEPLPASRYPTVDVTYNPQLGPETCTIDGSLYQFLFATYLIYGWTGIAATEAAIRAAAPADQGSRSGGTVVSIWEPTVRFFEFTRNLLGLLIRDTLANLEQQVAIAVVAHLSEASIKVTTAYTTEFNFTREKVRTVTRRVGEETVQIDIYATRAQDSAASGLLFQQLTETVRARAQFEQLEQQLAQIGDQVRTIRSAGYPVMGWSLLPMLINDEEALRLLADGAKAFLARLLQLVSTSSPLAILIVDKLKVGFDQPTMEDTFGETLFRLFDQLDELGARIDPGTSKVNELRPGIAKDRAVSWADIQAWPCPPRGPEQLVLAAADTANLDNDLSYAPLLAIPTWRFLVKTGRIDKDSFEFVVATRYLWSLDSALQQEAAQKRDTERYTAKINAVLDLAVLLMTLAGGGPALGLLWTFIQIASQVRAVTDQLAELDKQLKYELIDPDAFALEHLARTAQLRAAGEIITDDVMIQLALIALSAEFKPLAKFFEIHGYLSDIETLLADDTTSGVSPP